MTSTRRGPPRPDAARGDDSGLARQTAVRGGALGDAAPRPHLSPLPERQPVDRPPPRAHAAHASATPPPRRDADHGTRRSPVIEATPLRHHQQVVIVIRDARHVAERLTHALAEGVDRRAEGVIGIQSEGRIVIVGRLFDESSERCGDRPRDRLRVNRREGPGRVESRSQILDLMESRFPRGELGKVVAPDRAAVLLGRARVDDELAGGGKYPRPLRPQTEPGRHDAPH